MPRLWATGLGGTADSRHAAAPGAKEKLQPRENWLELRGEVTKVGNRDLRQSTECLIIGNAAYY
jgi:hypothetical protein